MTKNTTLWCVTKCVIIKRRTLQSNLYIGTILRLHETSTTWRNSHQPYSLVLLYIHTMFITCHLFRPHLSCNRGDWCAHVVGPTHIYWGSYVVSTLEHAEEPRRTLWALEITLENVVSIKEPWRARVKKCKHISLIKQRYFTLHVSSLCIQKWIFYIKIGHFLANTSRVRHLRPKCHKYQEHDPTYTFWRFLARPNIVLMNREE